MAAYPYTSEDVYDLKMKTMSSFMRHSVHGCFQKCAQRTDVPMLTVKEGLCFRNCITKLGSFVPTVNASMQGTSAEHYDALTQ